MLPQFTLPVDESNDKSSIWLEDSAGFPKRLSYIVQEADDRYHYCEITAAIDKREGFRGAFQNFNPSQSCQFGHTGRGLHSEGDAE